MFVKIRPGIFLHCISGLCCVQGPLSTVICGERCVCAAGNRASFVWNADAEPGWKSVPTGGKQQQQKKNPQRVKIIPHRSGWWQAAFWKRAALAYVQNISSTWERGDGGAYLCRRCGTENTVHVFLSVSQVDVSLTDTAALWGLL